MWANVGSHTRDYTYHHEVLLGCKQWPEEKEGEEERFSSTLKVTLERITKNRRN